MEATKEFQQWRSYLKPLPSGDNKALKQVPKELAYGISRNFWCTQFAVIAGIGGPIHIFDARRSEGDLGACIELRWPDNDRRDANAQSLIVQGHLSITTGEHS